MIYAKMSDAEVFDSILDEVEFPYLQLDARTFRSWLRNWMLLNNNFQLDVDDYLNVFDRCNREFWKRRRALGG